MSRPAPRGEGATRDLPAGLQGVAPGQVLGDRYQIRAQLGRGGMGEVWRALDLKLRVEVALKVLRSTLASDASRLELLRQEVRVEYDPTSDTGWKIEVGPFPGWATVPEWNP